MRANWSIARAHQSAFFRLVLLRPRREKLERTSSCASRKTSDRLLRESLGSCANAGNEKFLFEEFLDKRTSILALAREALLGGVLLNIATRDEWERYKWLGEERYQLNWAALWQISIRQSFELRVLGPSNNGP